jgi:D-serine deaminase-like pyridoxal phosphate-dependent protein
MASTMVKIDELKKRKLNSFYKGFPPAADGQSIEEFLSLKPGLFTAGFQFPMAVLRESALKNNLTRMAEFCKEVDSSLAPHVKTTMAPQIAKWQMDHGAWALTIANFSQARVFLDYGFKRLIIANEIVDVDSIRTIAKVNMKPEYEIIFYLDSFAGLDIIQKALIGMNDVRIPLLIEIGMEGGRGGIRDNIEITVLAEKVAQDPRLVLLGVSGFEGSVPGADRTAEGIAKIRVFCRKIVDAARILRPYVASEKIIISAGGSAYFEIVAQEFHEFGDDAHIVLRSGGYITHDHGYYAGIYPFSEEPVGKTFMPVIELWARVLTQPELGLAILNLGKRDVGNDLDEPFPIKRFTDEFMTMSGVIDHLNDQHGYLKFGKDQDIAVGDAVGLGISHPCTTFDKWRLIPLVNDQYEVVDCIHTFF